MILYFLNRTTLNFINVVMYHPPRETHINSGPSITSKSGTTLRIWASGFYFLIHKDLIRLLKTIYQN